MLQIYVSIKSTGSTLLICKKMNDLIGMTLNPRFRWKVHVKKRNKKVENTI